MGRTFKWTICILSLVLATNGWLFGQATASSALQGTVVDKTGAAVVGAEVSAINPATGGTRTVTTGGTGNYKIDPLSAGIYTIKVSMNSFSAAKAEKVQLLVGATTTQNFTLQPSGAIETVEINGAAPVVDQTKTGVSFEITPEEVTELPMIGRDVANLAIWLPASRRRIRMIPPSLDMPFFR